jgi:hypothetical protein
MNQLAHFQWVTKIAEVAEGKQMEGMRAEG